MKNLLNIFISVLPFLFGCKGNNPELQNDSQSTYSFQTIDSSVKKYDINALKLDAINFENLLRIIANKDLLNMKDSFINSLGYHDINTISSDFAFQFEQIQIDLSWNYINVGIKIFTYRNEIYSYYIGIAMYQNILDSIIRYNPNIFNNLCSHKIINPYSFEYRNELVLNKYKAAVEQKLGHFNGISNNYSDEAKSNFNLLTSPINNLVYGTNCGIGNQTLEGRLAINYFITKNDSESIRKILKGYNPAGRIYAIDALIGLVKNHKIVFSSDDTVVIKNIIDLNDPISTCSGCCIGSSETKQLIGYSFYCTLNQERENIRK